MKEYIQKVEVHWNLKIIKIIKRDKEREKKSNNIINLQKQRNRNR